MTKTVKTVAPQFAGIYAPRDDAQIFAGRSIPARCKLERRIVWNLLKHLHANGWEPVMVDDGGDENPVTRTPEAVMDAVFAVDDSHLYVRKQITEKSGMTHWIRLIGGNGIDMICDYSYSNGDANGFSAVMEAFDTEAYE